MADNNKKGGNAALKKKKKITKDDQEDTISSSSEDELSPQVSTEETTAKARVRPSNYQLRTPPKPSPVKKKAGNPPPKKKTTKDQTPITTSEETVVEERRGRPRKSQKTQVKPSPTPVTEIPPQSDLYDTRLNNIENNYKVLESKWEQRFADLQTLVVSKVQSKQITEIPLEVEEPYLSDIKADLQLNKYKNMCTLSQFKNDELQNENYDLQKKLETAVAKLEGYERGQQLFTESIGKVKDAYFASYLTKTAEKATDEAKAPISQSPKPKVKRTGKKVAQDEAPAASPPATKKNNVAVEVGN